MSTQPIITLPQIQARVSDTIYARGHSYFNQGAVSDCVRRGDRIEARCQGSYLTPYHVWAEFVGNEVVDTHCTCEYGDTWEGDCKHIIALLLTYLHKPEQFVPRQTVDAALAKRSKEDLIEIITQMVTRYPDLHSIIERPTVREVVEGEVTLDEEPLRRELLAALDYMGDWDDSTAEDKVFEFLDMGDQFAKRGDYQQAIAIYCLILEECNAHEYPTHDEGDFAVAISDVIAHLDELLDGAHLGEHDALRRRVLDALLGAYFWDIEYGGIGYGEGTDAVILGIVTQDDIAYVRQQLAAAIADTDDHGHNRWRLEAYEELQTELDRIEDIDPEVTLQRLRQEGLHFRLIDMLLTLQRAGEAIDIVRQELHELSHLIHGLNILRQHGQQDAAAAIAEARLNAGYETRLVNWLVDVYAERGDHEKLFNLQLQQMQVEPDIRHYVALQATARTVGNWEIVRPDILDRLAKAKKFDVLTQAYLHDKEWARAWETLAQTKQITSSQYWYPRLEFEVAEKTRRVFPDRAMPIYLLRARSEIEKRTRGDYATAAQLLREVRDMYQRMDNMSEWEQLIAYLREEFKRLRALQDELNQAGL